MKMIRSFLFYTLTLLLGASVMANSGGSSELVSAEAFFEEEAEVKNDQASLSELRLTLIRNVNAGRSDSVISLYLECERHDFSADPELGMGVYLQVANFFQQRNANEQAIHCRLKELGFHEKIAANKFPLDHFFCIGSVAVLYQKTGDITSAKKYYDKALIFAEKRSDPFMTLHAFNNLGLYYLKLNDNNKAIEYFNKACSVQGLKSERPVRLMLGIIRGNLATALMQQKEYEKSIPNFEENLKVSLAENELEDYAKTAVQYAVVLTQVNRLNDALAALKNGEALIKGKTFSKAESELFEQLFLTYLKLGQIEKSTEYWNKYTTLSRRIALKENQEHSAALEHLTDLQLARLEVDRSNKDLEVRLATSRLQRIIFLSGTILLAALVVILIFRRRNKEIAKEAMLEKVQKDLLSAELKNKELLQQKMDLELRSSKKDVTTLAMDLNQHEEIRKSLVKRLKEVRKVTQDSEAGEMVNNIIAEVNKQLSNGQSRALFNENISKVNNAFFEKLSQSYPALSKSELEFCGLLRLNLNSKEISSIKNISPDSAKVIRHRIRKKLELGSDVDIYKMLQEI